MNHKRIGRRTIALEHPPSVISYANIGGKLEGEGPLREHFDELEQDSFFGEKTWEKAESVMQKRVLQRALDQIKLKPGDLDYIFAGDLLNQCIGSSFGLREFGVPFYGLYGACSTMGESLSLAAMSIDGGFAGKAAAMTSSHFCTAERQYRMPVPYGNQRTPTAQWTATAAGCTILASDGPGPYITQITCGKIVDKGIADANNMGAAMAPVDVRLDPYIPNHWYCCITHSSLSAELFSVFLGIALSIHNPDAASIAAPYSLNEMRASENFQITAYGRTESMKFMYQCLCFQGLIHINSLLQRKKSCGFVKIPLHWKYCCGMIFQHSARRVDPLSVPRPPSPGLAEGLKPPEVKLN